MLTNRCGRGRFLSRLGNPWIIRFTDLWLSAVPPEHRDQLYDPDHLARPNETYLFRDVRTPICEVWVMEKTQPRRLFDPRGTAVPAVTETMRRDRRKKVESWPKE